MKILRTQFTQTLFLDQLLELVLIYTYLTMQLQMATHTHIQILVASTKLHLASTAHVTSWQEAFVLLHLKQKFSSLCRTDFNISTVPNIAISQPKPKVILFQSNLVLRTYKRMDVLNSEAWERGNENYAKESWNVIYTVLNLERLLTALILNIHIISKIINNL